MTFSFSRSGDHHHRLTLNCHTWLVKDAYSVQTVCPIQDTVSSVVSLTNVSSSLGISGIAGTSVVSSSLTIIHTHMHNNEPVFPDQEDSSCIIQSSSLNLSQPTDKTGLRQFSSSKRYNHTDRGQYIMSSDKYWFRNGVFVNNRSQPHKGTHIDIYKEGAFFSIIAMTSEAHAQQ